MSAINLFILHEILAKYVESSHRKMHVAQWNGPKCKNLDHCSHFALTFNFCTSSVEQVKLNCPTLSHSPFTIQMCTASASVLFCSLSRALICLMLALLMEWICGDMIWSVILSCSMPQLRRDNEVSQSIGTLLHSPFWKPFDMCMRVIIIEL